MKKIYKSRYDKKICGVCAGLGKYLDIDPTIIRLAWLFSVFCLGFGLVFYFIAALLLPYEDEIIEP